MSLWSILLIALSVSADAFAVALGKGLHMRSLNHRQAWLLAVTFGAFQALMPLLGWLGARTFKGSIIGWGHWVAFILLAGIGGKMLWEALHGSDDDDDDDGRIGVRELLLLAVATSLDALAVGISLAFFDVSIVEAVLVIGVTTLALTYVGVLIGHRAGLRFGRPAEIAGGVILILIGVKIVLDHLGVWG